MADSYYDYRNELRLILSERQKRNSRYSLRAMAKDLKISVTALHGVMKGERHLSKRNLVIIAKRLDWNDAKLEGAVLSTNLPEDPTESMLSEDRFRSIADWVHLAILNLARIQNVKVSSLGGRLGLEQNECEIAVERLVRLEMLGIEKGCLIRRAPSFGTSNDIPSAANRAFHHNNLVRAQKALDELTVDERHFLTIAAASNQIQLRALKQKIDEFRKEALQILKTENPDRVYFLNVHLFPVTKGEEV